MSKEKPIEATEVFSILSATINGANFDDLHDAVHKIVDIAGYCKQREGHWISMEEAELMDRFDLAYTCSVCGHCDWDCTESENFNFCPNCGAKMKGGTGYE